jgi:hypothetical protein
MMSGPRRNADAAIGSFTVAAIGGASQPHELVEKAVRWPA